VRRALLATTDRSRSPLRRLSQRTRLVGLFAALLAVLFVALASWLPARVDAQSRALVEARHLSYAAEETAALASLARGRPEPGALVGPLAGLAEAIAESRQGVDRVHQIVRGLQTFARADEDGRTPVDVAEALCAAIGMAEHALKHQARLERQLARAPRVDGNEVRALTREASEFLDRSGDWLEKPLDLDRLQRILGARG
jgi:hypothetical protein